MKSEPVRQNSIIDYMVARDPDRPYSTRDIATALNCTTNAALAAFKRLRIKGRVFRYQGMWHLTTSEKLQHSELQGSIDRHPSGARPF